MNCLRSRPEASARQSTKSSTVDRLAVMPFEIEVEPFAESLAAEQRLQHAADLGALLVDGRRVEIVDLDEGRRPHRVGEGPRVLRELMGLQDARIDDALDRAGAHVGGEFLVAEHGQPFLQAELKPVAAGDAVAGPVVEIFVRDHALDRGVVAVARRVGSRQHELVVEDIEALVLHRAHVEVADRRRC